MKHTPGPWKWVDYPDGRKLLCALDRAVIHSPDAPMTIDRPDQLVIAAAPDLLEACRAVVGVFEGHEDVSMYVQRCRIAVAKAEGR